MIGVLKMDEETEEITMPQNPKPSLNILPAPLQAMMFGAIGESLLLVGSLFFLVGFASFLGSLLGIKGSGEILVGFILIGLGFVLISKSKIVIKSIPPQRPAPKEPMIPIKQDPPSGYR